MGIERAIYRFRCGRGVVDGGARTVRTADLLICRLSYQG